MAISFEGFDWGDIFNSLMDPKCKVCGKYISGPFAFDFNTNESVCNECGKKETKQVYCNQCKHLDKDMNCNSPFNRYDKTIKAEDSWLKPDGNKVLTAYLKEPKYLNAGNNCIYFERKKDDISNVSQA